MQLPPYPGLTAYDRRMSSADVTPDAPAPAVAAEAAPAEPAPAARVAPDASTPAARVAPEARIESTPAGPAAPAEPAPTASVTPEPAPAPPAEPARTPLKVAILGSCVSRDAIAHHEEDYEVTGYLARTSLLSAGTNARHHLPQEFDMSSPFQQRNLLRDVEGGLLANLKSLADVSDVLMWDLVDERHGVCVFPDGSILTRSIDLLSVPELVEACEAGEILAFDSDEHFARWCGAATMFADALDVLGLKAKTIVIAADWAVLDTAGNPTPWSMGVRAKEANTRYAPYYQHLESLGFTVVRITDTVGDPEHKWGLAAFHFVPEVYETILAAVEDFAWPEPSVNTLPGPAADQRSSEGDVT